jgi:threonine/homoserine/homoserine lactone efflux protein
VTLVDFFYIALAIASVSKVLEKKSVNRVFVFVSSLILIYFGIMLIAGTTKTPLSAPIHTLSASLSTNFIKGLVLTASNPLTIVFFTGVFGAKALEYNYTKRNLYLFGFSAGTATFIFLGISSVILSMLKKIIPGALISIMNNAVGIILIYYGITRLLRFVKFNKFPGVSTDGSYRPTKSK